MKDECDTFGWCHRIEYDENSHSDRFVEDYPAGRIGDASTRATAYPLVGVRHRFGDPFADVVLAAGTC